MHSMHKIVLLGLLISLSGCVTTNQSNLTATASSATNIVSYGTHITLPKIDTGKPPEWLVRASTDYPAKDYYSVTRQANTADTAARKAYASAYKLLNPEQSSGSTELPQIKLAALWQGQGVSHALAVIPRHQAEAYLREQLNSLDTATQGNVDDLNITDDPLIKIGLLQTVIERQQLRAAIQKSLKKVDLAKEGRESPWNTRSWSLQMAALLKELRIIPMMDSSLSNTTSLTAMLKQGLENSGLRPARPFEADYILSGSLDIEETELNNGYTQANAQLQLRLQHKDKLTDYGTQNWALEVTSISAEGAKERLLNKAKRLLTADKRETIIGIAAQAGIQP